MAQKAISSQVSPSTQGQNQANGAETRPPEVADLLAKVGRHLQDNEPKRALDLIAQAKVNSSWVTNAAGVCQLRLGNSKVAVDVFRGLVLGPGGVLLRQDAPTVFKTNYAAALLAADNMAGCLSVLADIKEESPAVKRIREAIQRWKASLTLGQKIQWYLGGQPDRPLVPDFALGDLE